MTLLTVMKTHHYKQIIRACNITSQLRNGKLFSFTNFYCKRMIIIYGTFRVVLLTRKNVITLFNQDI